MVFEISGPCLFKKGTGIMSALLTQLYCTVLYSTRTVCGAADTCYNNVIYFRTWLLYVGPYPLLYYSTSKQYYITSSL